MIKRAGNFLFYNGIIDRCQVYTLRSVANASATVFESLCYGDSAKHDYQLIIYYFLRGSHQDVI